MIRQYELTLQTPENVVLDAAAAYRLYAALLEYVPAYSALLHRDGTTPISHYLTGKNPYIWHISLFGEEAERQFSPVIESVEQFTLRNPGSVLQKTDMHRLSVPDLNTLLKTAEGRPKQTGLRFQTPTCFKSHERYEYLPTPRLILRSIAQKWNGYFSDICPLEDEDGQGLDAIASGMYCREYCLHSDVFRLKGQKIPGFVGTMVLENHNRGFHRQLTDLLLTFADFSGVGVKTALGMGGVTTYK